MTDEKNNLASADDDALLASIAATGAAINAARETGSAVDQAVADIAAAALRDQNGS